jgi:hypothetical protein
VFEEVSVADSVLNFGVYYNYSITNGRDIVSAMSLVTEAFATFLPSPRIVADFCTSASHALCVVCFVMLDVLMRLVMPVGVRKLPQEDDYNEFDITTLVGGLFFSLILHQLLPLYLSVCAIRPSISVLLCFEHDLIFASLVVVVRRAWSTRRRTGSGR